MKKVRWGIISTAKIGTAKVIPAMQRGEFCAVTAIASRNVARARQTALQLGIPKAYGSYEDLLGDPEIDAVYNPLPNHLHVPVSIQAIQAGKHVLCEKPLALTSAEAQQLVDVARQHPHLKVMEAFMYRHHPQWQKARSLVREGQIGTLRTIQSFFSYFNDDPDNIRNDPRMGGGGLMDIGCYPISLSRFIFDAEPQRVFGTLELDPRFHTDRLASAILDFGTGTSAFTCSMQLAAVPARKHLRHDGQSGNRDPLQCAARPSVPTVARTGQYNRVDRVRDVRPIHDPRRPVRPGNSGRHRCPHAADRRRGQHACD